MTPYVQAKVHERVEGGSRVIALVTSNGALKLAVESLVDDALAVFGIRCAAVRKVQGVKEELHVLMGVLLLITSECLGTDVSLALT